MEKDQTTVNTVEELDELKKKYEELQLRITRFSVTEQELIHARNRLDREVLIYRRMQQFNSLAFDDMPDDGFMKMVCESLLDIFEVEIGMVMIEWNNREAHRTFHIEGYTMDPQSLSAVAEALKKMSNSQLLGEATHVRLSGEEAIRQHIPLKTLIFTQVRDPEIQVNITLLCGNTDQGSRFYDDIREDREAAFYVFAQQVLAHQINRYKTQKIKQHVNTLTQDQERITRIAESFIKFDTQPEKNIKKTVQLAAEMLSAKCAVLENLNGQPLVFAAEHKEQLLLPENTGATPCYDLMQGMEDSVQFIPRLHLPPAHSPKSWIHQFNNHSFIGSVIHIDQEPIGTLALFLNGQDMISENMLQLIRILSVAIAVEERRKRALLALQESEEKYRVMFEGSPNGILVVDTATLLIQYVNPSISSMFGYTPNDMLDMNVLHLHPPEQSDEISVSIKNVPSRVQSLVKDVRCVRKDGSLFFADIYSNSISFGGRNLVAGFFSDVTQRRYDQQQLLENNTELKKINAELDNFVYSVSHDLRAPLLAIQGLIRLITDSQQHIPTESASYLKMVMASVNRMDETIKEILEYSRNARLDISVVPIDFQEMIDEIFHDVKHMFPKSLNLQLHIDEQESFHSDPYRINTLLKNLIGNAVKYQRPNANESYLKITIKADHHTAWLQFEDNGEGIPPEHIDKIFDMFYRASNTTIGTGLGLYICREITNNLGGSIQVESVPGSGSIFTIELKNLKR